LANANRASGLAPVQYLDGTKYTGSGRAYFIPSTDSNAYAIGDPVASLTGGASAAGVPAVILATAGTGNALRGVIVATRGVVYGAGFVDPTGLDTTIIPATKTKGYYVLVEDNPQVIFEAQEDSVGGALAVTAIGKNINLVSGANSGYLSGWQLQSSSQATGSTLQCKLLMMVQRRDNAVGTNAKWLVMINNHELRGGVTGV